MDRRGFIRLVGGGVVLAATAACAPVGPDPRAAWDNPGAGETDPRRKALAWAILAPNPHNMQPWLADLRRPGEIGLYVDRSRMLPVTDPFNRQIVIGCGAFLELLRMALAEQGLTATVIPFPDGEPWPVLDGRPVARVVVAGRARPDPLFAQALERRTNRGRFTETPVTEEDLRAILASAPMSGPVTPGGTVEAADVAVLRGLVHEGAWIEAHTPAAHQESVSRTFIGAAEVRRHPYGISLDTPLMTTMNAEGILTKAKMATPGTRAFAESLSFLKAGADTARGFVWLTTGGDTRVEQVAAGQAYLRGSLAATARGLAMQPWSQGLQEYASQKPVFAALHRRLAPGGGRVQMLSRIGHPKTEVPPAPRRGLAANLRGV